MASKRKTNTLKTKYMAILEVEKGNRTMTQGFNTLSTWLKKADDYKKADETQGFGPKNKRMWMLPCMPG